MSVEIQEYFDVIYGVNLELVNLQQSNMGINFVSRTSQNNGVSAKVSIIPNITPNPSNTISVSCGGSVMESFLQKEEYYSGRDVYILKPKIRLSDKQLLFYCLCLKSNKYRYNYGRQPNKTLKQIRIPSIAEIPYWVNEVIIPKNPDKKPFHSENMSLYDKRWKWFYFIDLFNIKKGKRRVMSKINKNGKYPFVSSISVNNGVKFMTNIKPNQEEKVITVNYNGSVAEAFYQPEPFWASDDVNVLYPKFELNPYIAMFLITIIRKEKYRFNYGRKWHKERMEQSKIKLPIIDVREPDWKFMEDYIKSLPYSNAIMASSSSNS